MIRSLAIASVAFALFAFDAAAQERAPDTLVDEGACPFECCQYGDWTATRATPAFESPDDGAKQAAVIPPGAAVTALGGFVRTVGQPFVVARAHGPYKPGDTLMVYTYQGEGAFKVWHKGRQFTEDLGFSPYGGTGGQRCTEAPTCWGSLARELQPHWWAKVRLADGRVAWVRGSDDFQGQDACGQASGAIDSFKRSRSTARPDSGNGPTRDRCRCRLLAAPCCRSAATGC